MELKETELTPELAAQLLANPHPNQRRPARMTVQSYARSIREGRWRLVTDAILVDSEGRMFNGGHRCAAVIAAHRSIPIYIHWGADPELFDVIDVGRRRSAYQFVHQTEPTGRASAARMTLWYEKRFDRPPVAPHVYFDMQEIMGEVERRADAFDAVIPLCRKVYEYTGIPWSVSMAAFAIAHGFGYQEQMEAFVDGVADPSYLDADDPARLLADRYRRTAHRTRRRPATEDWTMLVRALNVHLEGRRTARLALTDLWPRVAESEVDFNRRRAAAVSQKRRNEQRRDDATKAS